MLIVQLTDDETGDEFDAIPVPAPAHIANDIEQQHFMHQVLASALRATADLLEAADDQVEALDDWFTIADVAEMCQVQVQTVHRWRLRDRETTMSFPPPDVRIADRPLWEPYKIAKWAMDTGRFVGWPRDYEPAQHPATTA